MVHLSDVLSRFRFVSTVLAAGLVCGASPATSAANEATAAAVQVRDVTGRPWSVIVAPHGAGAGPVAVLGVERLPVIVAGAVLDRSDDDGDRKKSDDSKRKRDAERKDSERKEGAREEAKRKRDAEKRDEERKRAAKRKREKQRKKEAERKKPADDPKRKPERKPPESETKPDAETKPPVVERPHG
ncbi:MAG: hypothetical protein KY476_17270, partial [Planctomycetes bacterium]|nr:hypothetical protein [Planctomycetota bacterium]